MIISSKGLTIEKKGEKNLPKKETIVSGHLDLRPVTFNMKYDKVAGSLESMKEYKNGSTLEVIAHKPLSSFMQYLEERTTRAGRDWEKVLFKLQESIEPLIENGETVGYVHVFEKIKTMTHPPWHNKGS